MTWLLPGKLGWSSQENGDREAHSVINSFHPWMVSFYLLLVDWKRVQISWTSKIVKYKLLWISVCRYDNTNILFKIICFSLFLDNTIKEDEKKLEDLFQWAKNCSMHTKMIFCLKWEKKCKVTNKQKQNCAEEGHSTVQ